MSALWNIGAAVLTALPAICRIAWDLKWHGALQRESQVHKTAPTPPAVSTPPAGIRPPGLDGITLIVCSHNDLALLQSNWDLWRGQQFPDHWSAEWLVVDDGSEDGTAEWLAPLAANDAQLTVVRHSKTRPGKKDALAAGIMAARHECLVLTDADCKPQPHWARDMVEALTAETAENAPHRWDIALGVCLPDGGPALLTFDALRVAFQYAGEAAAGRPYMGVGRNIAYRRSAWESLGGFDAHADLASGDDDLFVQDAVHAGMQIRLVYPSHASASNHVLPSPDWKDGWLRKRRHLTTAGRYGWGTWCLLGLDAILDPLIVAAAVASPLGLLHKHVWIPMVAMALAAAVRAFTLSEFSKVWSKKAFPWWRCFLWGPVRWSLLVIATVRNVFTSSPTWTQRAPTSRS